ncbi:MAG: hypothetical protein WD426_18480 [Anditalea sp.]
MKKPIQLIFLFPLLLFSCINVDLKYKTLDFEVFTLKVPNNWESFSSQGYDSIVGGITNGKDELAYDYGWYSYDFQNETTETHRRITTSIDGKPALIVLPIKKGEGIIGVYIEVDSQNKFNLFGRDIKNEDRIRKIFESVKF